MFQTLIDCETLFRHLTDAAWVVVDCRFDLMQPTAGREAYAEGHIAGARYADLNQDLSAPITARSGRHPLPEPEAFARRLGRWGIGNASQVVAYDAVDGMYAVRLWWMLRWLGHSAVAVLDGGYQAWREAGLAVSSVEPQPDTQRFTARLVAGQTLSASELRANLDGGALQVVDARAAPRFAGELEPIDPVAGHIPGAVNYPYAGNLDRRGRFLPADRLRARFARFAASPSIVVHMCGSGVTACHNLLAMEIAGLHGSRLYPGSWSEWVQDPDNPVARSQDA